KSNLDLENDIDIDNDIDNEPDLDIEYQQGHKPEQDQEPDQEQEQEQEPEEEIEEELAHVIYDLDVDREREYAYGRVYLVVSKDFGIVAAKVMDLQHFNQQEWDIAGKMFNGTNVCQYVVNYKGAQIIKNSAVFLMEYANLPPMQKILDNKLTSLPREDFVKPIIWQLLQGVVVIHEAGLIHQNLKPDNIMFHNIFGTENVIVKITDFGLLRDYFSLHVGETQCGHLNQ
ncbi:MAG: hypothetical protein EZS28_022922, partial [Streblomastix strix]